MKASANLDVVHSIYAAWERGDFSSAEWAHPEIEFVFADGVAPGSWTGLPAMRTRVRDMLEAWEEFRIEAEDYRELDDQRVLVLEHRSGRGKTSGVDLSQLHGRSGHLFQIRDGMVTTLVNYWDRDRALAELGLPPEVGSE